MILQVLNLWISIILMCRKERCGGLYGSEMLEEEGTGLAHVCQTNVDDGSPSY